MQNLIISQFFRPTLSEAITQMPNKLSSLSPELCVSNLPTYIFFVSWALQTIKHGGLESTEIQEKMPGFDTHTF